MPRPDQHSDELTGSHAKTQWLDRRVTFNISAFYAHIKDLQATTTAGSCSSRMVFNVPTARSEGVEAELFARPNRTAELALDYERGRRARVGYLTNQPRTYGVYGRYEF